MKQLFSKYMELAVTIQSKESDSRLNHFCLVWLTCLFSWQGVTFTVAHYLSTLNIWICKSVHTTVCIIMMLGFQSTVNCCPSDVNSCPIKPTNAAPVLPTAWPLVFATCGFFKNYLANKTSLCWTLDFLGSSKMIIWMVVKQLEG